eukprot:1054294-Lingulodinium_polyedra.AAC.1
MVGRVLAAHAGAPCAARSRARGRPGGLPAFRLKEHAPILPVFRSESERGNLSIGSKTVAGM